MLLLLLLLGFMQCTESSKYYAHIQTAVAGGLGMPTARLADHHSDTASKHSLYYFRSFFRVDGHAHGRTFAKRRS